MKAQWFDTAQTLVNNGFRFAGLCGCQARARLYRRRSLTVKIYPSIKRIKLYVNNKSITPYEHYANVEKILSMAQETEMAAGK